jgi:hypothetical protein
MIERITVWVGKDWDGFTFRLRPKTREMLRAKFPEASMLPQISISFDSKSGFEAIHGPIYRHVLELLTGLSRGEIDAIGGGVFVDAVSEMPIYDTKKEV